MAIISSLKKDDIEGAINGIALEVYESFEKESGSVPEWVTVMAHRPVILKEFTELFKVIMGPGKIDNYLKWKIAYTVSDALRCPFCVDVTKKMLIKFGADEKIISDIKEEKDLPAKEKAILGLVRDVTDNANVDNPAVFEKLKEKMTEAQIVEVVSVIGLFNYINRFNNTFAILPE